MEKSQALIFKKRQGNEKPEEDLNIERNWKYMTLYALRKYRGAKEASKYLRVSERTVFRLIDRWELDWKCPDLTKDE